MPDWVYSRLTVKGDGAEKLLESLCEPLDDSGKLKEDDGECLLDFNKIVPMPKELNIIAGSVTDNCVRAFVASIDSTETEKWLKYKKAYEKAYGDVRDVMFMSASVLDALIKKTLEIHGDPKEEPYFKTEKDVLDYGQRALDNVIKFGHKDWYDWSCANWGTKWNACQCYINGNIITFATAWSDVRGLISKLSKQHPEFLFIYEYAHEQVGFFTGRYEFKRGATVSSVLYGDYTREAYELAFELAGGDGGFEFDEETQNYKPIDE